MGEEPSHPELLDWLATELIARGLEPEGDAPPDRDQRDLSASRRSPVAKSSSADPDNLLFSRQNRRRLDGEAIRDALLVRLGLAQYGDERPLGFSGAARASSASSAAKVPSGPFRPGSPTAAVAASTSSSGATSATHSLKSSIARTRTQAARAVPSQQSRRRHSRCSTAAWPSKQPAHLQAVPRRLALIRQHRLRPPPRRHSAANPTPPNARRWQISWPAAGRSPAPIWSFQPDDDLEDRVCGFAVGPRLPENDDAAARFWIDLSAQAL